MSWIKDLRESLGMEGREGETSAEDLELAAAVLLIEMARADQSLDQAELKAVSRALSETFPDLHQSVGKLVSRAQGETVDLTSFFPYIEQINGEWSRDRKVQLLTQLWRVAHADGRIDKFEENYLRRICELLHLPPKTFIQVREGFIE